MKHFRISGSKKLTMFYDLNEDSKIVAKIPNNSIIKVLDDIIYYRDTIRNEPMRKVKYGVNIGYVIADSLIDLKGG